MSEQIPPWDYKMIERENLHPAIALYILTKLASIVERVTKTHLIGPSDTQRN